jgi:hypothetical protein
VAKGRGTGRSGKRVSRARTRPKAAAPAEVVAEAPGAETDLLLSTPEPAMAARALPPESPRPLPSSRRAIFFDVENTSRAEHIARVIAHLAVDRIGRRTEFVAVGNWRVIGNDTARLLARHGAALVHSAPSVGVRDWSDLRIAVGSGVWLAGARPGDVIEIVSDDRAFDAVGDVAASLGVTFRRLSYRGLLGIPAEAAAEVEAAGVAHQSRGESGDGRRHRRRGGRGRSEHGGRGRGEPGVSRPVHPAPVHHAPRPEAGGGDAPHTAPHDEIVSVVSDLARSGRPVTLDSLANALKSRGFSRPTGSPRLITRLRRIKDLEISRAGVITLVGGAAAAPEPGERQAKPEETGEPVEREAESVGREAEPVERETEPVGREAEPVEREAEPVEGAEPGAVGVEAAEAGNDAGGPTPSGGEGDRRGRRSRRGGRRRRGRGGREGGGGGDGRGGGEPPRGRDSGPRDSGPRDSGPRDSSPRGTGADRARDVASRYAPRDVAPSWISGQPLA